MTTKMNFTKYLDLTFKTLLLAGIGLVPLAGYSFGFGYEQIKVLFFLTIVTLAALSWLILLKFEPTKYNLKWNQIKISSTVFILILGLTSLLGINPFNSLVGQAPYYQGLIFYLYLYLFSLLVSSESIKLEYWALSISLSSAVVSLIAVKEFIQLNLFHEQILTYAGRVISSFGQPNFYSGFLLFSLPFVYLLSLKKDKVSKFLAYFCFGLILVGVGISFSRSTIFILAGFLAFWVLHKIIKSYKALWGVGIFALIFGIMFSLTLSSGIFYDEIIRPITSSSRVNHEFSIERRAFIWPVVTQLVLQRPLLGYGLDNLGQAYATYEAPRKIWGIDTIGVSALVVDRSHNLILDLLIFSGVVGLCSFIYLLIQLLHHIKHGVAFAFIITFLLWMCFQNPSAVHLIFFWLVVGLIDQRHRLREKIDKAF